MALEPPGGGFRMFEAFLWKLKRLEEVLRQLDETSKSLKYRKVRLETVDGV